MHHPRNDPQHTPARAEMSAPRRADAPAADPQVLSRFRTELDALEARWRDEADTEGVFNTQIADLGQRLLDAVPAAAPGAARLSDMLTIFAAEKMTDDDVAEEIIYCAQDVTDQVSWPRPTT